MNRYHRWYLWFTVLLFAMPIGWRLASSGELPLPGLKAYSENLVVAVPVFMLALIAALLPTNKHLCTVRSSFMFSGALALAGVALFVYFHGGGAIALIICAYVLSEEGRRQLEKLRRGAGG